MFDLVKINPTSGSCFLISCTDHDISATTKVNLQEGTARLISVNEYEGTADGIKTDGTTMYWFHCMDSKWLIHHVISIQGSNLFDFNDVL